MKSLFRKIVAVFGLVVMCGCTSHRVPDSIPDSSPDDRARLVAFRPSQPERWTLPNGLRVVFVRNNEIPMVSGSLIVRGGGLWEPKVGVSPALGSLQRSGGAGPLDADQLDEKLEKLSASVSSGVGPEFSTVSFGSLSSDLDEVFSIFADVVFRPRFDEKRFELWRKHSIEEVRRRTDEPWTVAGISFNQLTFGTTPYGRATTMSSIRAITREDLKSFHQKLFYPDDGYLVVAGGVERLEVERLALKYFGDWKPRGVNEWKLPPVDYSPKPGFYFVELPLTQASVYMGQQGVPRLTPDMIAIDGFNQVFGSGFFGSRLSRKIRAELGLAYAIFGGVMPGPVKGKTLIAFQTKADSVGDAIYQSIGELKKLQNDPVSNSELDEVKRGSSNSFVFKFESVESAASRIVNQEIYGFPKDYDDTYVAKIQALTPADVQAVAKNRWDLSQFVVVVVGDKTAYQALQTMLKQHPEQFHGMPLRKMKFDQILQVK